MQRDNIRKAVLNEASYMVKHKCTVRELAKEFGISKSTAHADMVNKLKTYAKTNKRIAATYYKVVSILEHNKAVRHIRGGAATANVFKLRAEANNTTTTGCRL